MTADGTAILLAEQRAALALGVATARRRAQPWSGRAARPGCRACGRSGAGGPDGGRLIADLADRFRGRTTSRGKIVVHVVHASVVDRHLFAGLDVPQRQSRSRRHRRTAGWVPRHGSCTSRRRCAESRSAPSSRRWIRMPKRWKSFLCGEACAFFRGTHRLSSGDQTRTNSPFLILVSEKQPIPWILDGPR